MITREGIAHRTMRLHPDDYAAVSELYNAYYRHFGRDRRISVTDMESFATAPDYVPDQTMLVEMDGRLVAYSEFIITKEKGSAWTDGVVHPDYTGRGLGHMLLETVDPFIIERANASLGADHPLTILRGCSSKNAAAIHLLESNGYTHTRTFYEMRIDLANAQPPQPLPEELRFEPFDREKHGHALYEAHEEAFSEHWGYERDTWDEWQHYVYDRAGVDPTLWFIAWDGDQIAGYSINRQFSEDNASLAWVGQLGVRKPWRKRGLGAALLNHSFAGFKERGYTIAGLGVDSENTTNALALYERVGMSVHYSTYSFRKPIR